MGHCKLCQRRALLRRSHIISKFALRDAHCNNPQSVVCIPVEGTPRPILNQSWDQERLLCSDCENRRRHWEKIVAGTIAGFGDGREQRPELYRDSEYPRDLIYAEEVRYGEVKLWVLSTLFLMHHAMGIDWEKVGLTVDEEQRLRSRLLSGSPGSDLDFQIFGQMTIRSSIETRGIGTIIIPGFITESRDGRVCTRMGHFSVLDCHWAVLLGDWPDNPMRCARLRENGTWRALRESEDEVMIEAARRLQLIP